MISTGNWLLEEEDDEEWDEEDKLLLLLLIGREKEGNEIRKFSSFSSSIFWFWSDDKIWKIDKWEEEDGKYLWNEIRWDDSWSILDNVMSDVEMRCEIKGSTTPLNKIYFEMRDWIWWNEKMRWEREWDGWLNIWLVG